MSSIPLTADPVSPLNFRIILLFNFSGPDCGKVFLISHVKRRYLSWSISNNGRFYLSKRDTIEFWSYSIDTASVHPRVARMSGKTTRVLLFVVTQRVSNFHPRPSRVSEVTVNPFIMCFMGPDCVFWRVLTGRFKKKEERLLIGLLWYFWIFHHNTLRRWGTEMT